MCLLRRFNGNSCYGYTCTVSSFHFFALLLRATYYAPPMDALPVAFVRRFHRRLLLDVSRGFSNNRYCQAIAIAFPVCCSQSDLPSGFAVSVLTRNCSVLRRKRRRLRFLFVPFTCVKRIYHAPYTRIPPAGDYYRGSKTDCKVRGYIRRACV